MGIEIAVTELRHCQALPEVSNRPFGGSLVKQRRNDCYAAGITEWRMTGFGRMAPPASNPSLRSSCRSKPIRGVRLVSKQPNDT